MSSDHRQNNGPYGHNDYPISYLVLHNYIAFYYHGFIKLYNWKSTTFRVVPQNARHSGIFMSNYNFFYATR